MSLLERLKSIQISDKPGIVERAFAMRGAAPEETSAIPATGPVDPAAAVRALVRELSTIDRSGIETPSHLFSLLNRHLHVSKGAILMPDRLGDLLPWAVSGLDTTSRRRLRLSAATIEPHRTAGTVFLTGDERKPFRKALSSREYREALRIALFPFVLNKQLLAVLVIFDSPFLDLDDDILRVLLAALSDAAASMLFQGRQKALTTVQDAIVYPERQANEAIATVTARAEERSTEPIALRIDLASVVAAVSANHPHLEVDRLRHDLFLTTAALVADESIVVPVDGDSLLLLMANRAGVDDELLVHQLGITLNIMFGISVDPPSHETLDFEQLSAGT